MTTTIEIIDTAVKIGLGALISGIATYVVTKRNHDHEIKKSVANDKKELLLELTKTLDSSFSIRNTATLSIWRKMERGDNDFEIEYKLLTDVINEVKLAISYSYLIGNIDMANHIEDIFASFEEERMHLENSDRDVQFIDDGSAKRDKLLAKVRSISVTALDDIYA